MLDSDVIQCSGVKSRERCLRDGRRGQRGLWEGCWCPVPGACRPAARWEPPVLPQSRSGQSEHLSGASLGLWWSLAALRFCGSTFLLSLPCPRPGLWPPAIPARLRSSVRLRLSGLGLGPSSGQRPACWRAAGREACRHPGGPSPAMG